MFGFLFLSCVFFFFKQKTAYEMRISDWSSDVCSSDPAIEDAASVAVEEAFGVSNRFSDAVCALEAVVTNAATVEDASSHALCPKFHLPFDIFSIFIPVLDRSEEHTSELQSLMRISYAVFCLKKKKQHKNQTIYLN